MNECVPGTHFEPSPLSQQRDARVRVEPAPLSEGEAIQATTTMIAKPCSHEGEAMTSHDSHPQRDLGFTRRTALRRAGGTLAAMTLPAGLLEACGGTSSSGGSATHASGGNSAIGFFGFPGDDFANSKTLKAFLKARGEHMQTTSFPSAPVPSIIQLTRSGRASGIDLIDAFTLLVPSLQDAGGVGTYLQPIDSSKVPNAKNLIPELQGSNQAWWVNGKPYAVPVSVSPNSPVWAASRVTKPIKSYNDLLDPQFKGRLGFISFPEINYSLAVNLLRLNPGSPEAWMPKSRLSDAIDLMKKVHAQARVSSPNNADSINALTAGDIDVIWGGYPGIAVLANQSKPQTKGAYAIFPGDGNVYTIQGWGVAAKAPSPDAAYAAINEALSPQVQAEYNNFIVQGPAVTGVDNLLEPSLRSAYSAQSIGKILKQYQAAVEPPTKSDKYVTNDEWTAALASVTG
jgi:spermidine/putrescine transport system substrate-binding protein